MPPYFNVLFRYILDLLLSVTEDEVQWCRAMYHLRNLFWPGGQFDTSQRERLSEQESIQLKCQAQKVIKEFFPSEWYTLHYTQTCMHAHAGLQVLYMELHTTDHI